MLSPGSLELPEPIPIGAVDCPAWFRGEPWNSEHSPGNLVLGPEELALLRAAFDATWTEVAPGDASSIGVARLRLATLRWPRIGRAQRI